MHYTVHGILQARILEWVASPSSWNLPNPGIKPRSPTLQVDSLPAELPGKPIRDLNYLISELTWYVLTSFSINTSGEGNGNPLQYSCLENPRVRGAWWAAVSGVAQSQKQLKRLSKTVKSVVLGTVVCCVSCLVMSNPMDCDLCPWNSPGKNTGVNYYSLLQGIFPTQGWNPSLPYCRQILYHWATREDPWAQSTALVNVNL